MKNVFSLTISIHGHNHSALFVCAINVVVRWAGITCCVGGIQRKRGGRTLRTDVVVWTDDLFTSKL